MNTEHVFKQAGISCHSSCTELASSAEQRVAGDMVPWEAFSSPKAVPLVLQVYDDGKCTKLSRIKRFFSKKHLAEYA